MERLTMRNSDGTVGQLLSRRWADALERLAAYEDTGLEPGDFKRVFNEDAVLMLAAQYLGTTPDRLSELVKADRDGRVVVPPCKVGCEVWTNLAMAGWYFRDKDRPYAAKVVFVGLNSSDKMGGGLFNVVYGKGDHMMQFAFSDIGKTVFLTREAAVAALEARKGGDAK